VSEEEEEENEEKCKRTKSNKYIKFGPDAVLNVLWIIF
jgi:hypothetical protein